MHFTDCLLTEMCFTDCLFAENTVEKDEDFFKKLCV